MNQNREKIIEYRKKHTLAETGKKYGITAERVRQICLVKHQKRCVKHDRFYYNSCSHCLSESYVAFIRRLSTGQLYDEVKKEANNRKRDYLSTRRRIELIRLMKEMGLPFPYISGCLKRDSSTVRHLYNTYIKNK